MLDSARAGTVGRERELELLGKCIQRVLKNLIASTNQQTAETNSPAGEQTIGVATPNSNT